MKIKVSEVKPGVLRVGGGANNENDVTITGYMGLTYNNIRGTARAINTRWQLSRNLLREDSYVFFKLSMGYLEPYLFGSKNRGRVNFRRSQSEADYDKERNILQVADVGALDFLIEKDITDHLKGVWTLWGIENRRIFQTFNKDSLFEEQKQSITKTDFSLDYDRRNNPFLPEKGYYTGFGVTYADPAFGGSEEINFIKLETHYSYYLPLYKRTWIWANSLRGGYVSNLIKNLEGSGVPANYAFFFRESVYDQRFWRQ